MREGYRGIGLRQASLGLALLAGFLIGMVACGDDGEPEATPPASGPADGTEQPPATTATPGGAATPVETVFVTPTIVIGLDMDSSGNSATELGSADRCVSVSAESEEEFEVDVFLDGLSMDSVLGFGYGIDFPQDVVELVEQEHTMLVEAEEGSAAIELSNEVPAASSPHMVNVADLGPAEYSPPYTQGVLGRYTFRVLPTAEAGTYNLILTDMVIGRDTKADANYPGYPLTGAVPVVAIWDGAFEPPYGILAVDVSCDSVAATTS